MRSLCLLAFGCLAGLLLYTYDLKFKTRQLEARAQTLVNELQDESDFVALMRAEAGYLARPERIEDMARRDLKLEPIARPDSSRGRLSSRILVGPPGPGSKPPQGRHRRSDREGVGSGRGSNRVAVTAMSTLATVLQKIGGSPGRGGAARRVRRAQVLLSLCFLLGFAAVSARTIYYAEYPGGMAMLASSGAPPGLAKTRPDIVDRNGTLLATDIRIYWLAANPREIPHADEAAEKLTAIFPDLNQGALSRKFHDKASRFEWVKRGLTPNQAAAVHGLGIPGLTLLPTVQRAYPAGNEAAQILGITNVDNEGMSGIEWYIDQKLMGQLTPASPEKRPYLKLSLDVGVQHALAEELSQAMRRYQAQAALGLVLNVRNGEVAGLAVAAGLRSEPPGRGQGRGPPQPDRHRCLRAWLGVQDLHRRHGARRWRRHPLRPLRHRRAPDGPFSAPRFPCGARADDGRGYLRSLY